VIILLFSTTLRDEALRSEYQVMNARTCALAEATPGFVSWTEYAGDGGETLGIIEWESEEGLRLWRDAPEHAEVHRSGQEAVYGRYRVRICQVIRESSFDSTAS